MEPRFIVPLKEIGPGRELQLVLESDWLIDALSETDVEPWPEETATVRARLSTSGSDVVVRGEVRAVLRAQCARCLGPARLPIVGDLSLLLVPAGGGGTKALTHEFSDDEADLDTFSNDEVVLDGFIREAILLEIPISPLCSEQCPGIDAGSQQDQSPELDPRLKPLLEIRKRQL